jgi:hypothetical protein
MIALRRRKLEYDRPWPALRPGPTSARFGFLAPSSLCASTFVFTLKLGPTSLEHISILHSYCPGHSPVSSCMFGLEDCGAEFGGYDNDGKVVIKVRAPDLTRWSRTNEKFHRRRRCIPGSESVPVVGSRRSGSGRLFTRPILLQSRLLLGSRRVADSLECLFERADRYCQPSRRSRCRSRERHVRWQCWC